MKNTVKLEIEVPKGVLNFLADLVKFAGVDMPPKDVIEEEVAKLGSAIAHEIANSWFRAEDLVTRYGLETSTA
jgi:hypothetical protein